MLDFSDEMENCVLTCRRIFRFFEALKRDRTIAPMDRVTRNLIESSEKKLTPCGTNWNIWVETLHPARLQMGRCSQSF